MLPRCNPYDLGIPCLSSNRSCLDPLITDYLVSSVHHKIIFCCPILVTRHDLDEAIRPISLDINLSLLTSHYSMTRVILCICIEHFAFVGVAMHRRVIRCGS